MRGEKEGTINFEKSQKECVKKGVVPSGVKETAKSKS